MRVWAVDMDKCKPRRVYKERQGGNGFWLNDKYVAYTLDTTIVHAVAVIGCNWERNAEKETSSERKH